MRYSASSRRSLLILELKNNSMLRRLFISKRYLQKSLYYPMPYLRSVKPYHTILHMLLSKHHEHTYDVFSRFLTPRKR